MLKKALHTQRKIPKFILLSRFGKTKFPQISTRGNQVKFWYFSSVTKVSREVPGKSVFTKIVTVIFGKGISRSPLYI